MDGMSSMRRLSIVLPVSTSDVMTCVTAAIPILFLALATPGVAARDGASASAPRATAEAADGRGAALSRRPLIFEPAGTGEPRRFLMRGTEYNAVIGATDVLVVPRVARTTEASRSVSDLRFQFAGADPSATIRGARKLPGRSNYFTGADPKRWRTGVPNYSRVTVEGIYPGVDLVYYGRGREMEFDLIVAPGADSGCIQIEVAGDHCLEVNEQGDLIIQVRGGPFRLRRPHVYQTVDGDVRVVDTRYAVLTKSPGRVGFELAAYDTDLPLVIDPVLAYANRFGGSDAEDTADIAVDSDGNVYITGWTRSTNFPAPAGESPKQIGSGGDADAFVLKLSADGSTVLYSTFLGGTRLDQGLGIAVDAQNNAYVGGTTSFVDSGFPTTDGAYRTAPADFFISKLDATGNVVYSTFFGGLNIASFGGLAVHGSGDSARVYLVGTTVRGFPTTENAYRREIVGGSDTFLSILEPGQSVRGDQLVYSTLFDGSGIAVAAGPDGAAYITGDTVGADLTLRHAFDTVYAGNREAFMAVFDPSRTGDDSLRYSTYIGGDRDENGAAGHGGIAVAPSGVALVAGTTSSFDFPVTPEAIRVSRESSDGFLVVIDPSLPGRDSLLYGTYFGGTASDAVTDVAAGPPGIAYLVGYTLSPDIPGGDGEVAAKFGAGSGGFRQDSYIAKIDWTRVGDASLIDAAYVGGTEADFAVAITVDSSGAVYIAGNTASADGFAPSPGPGGQDGFVARLDTIIQLPDGVVGSSSTDTLSAGFGTGPHAWTVLSGSPPAGLELAGDGTLSGRPAEAGSSTFTALITDSLGATRQRSYRKRIGAGISAGDVLIRKAGVTPVPGRTFPYYILLRNRSGKTLFNVGVVELLQGWFEFISSSPPPRLLERRPTGNVYWTIPRMEPGEFDVIAYNVRLPPEFPLGVDVSGEACLTEEDCDEERAACVDEGKERCDDSSCGWHTPDAHCLQCNKMEEEQCRQEWMRCKGLVGLGSSEALAEGTSGGGCWTFDHRTDRPVDPNEKEVASGPFIPPGEVLGYTIHFENIGTIEARDVFLTDVLDADLDLSTVWVSRRLGGLERLAPDTTVSIFDDDDEEWSVTLDSASRTISWDLININLPAGETDGVFFVVQAPEDLPTGTEIRNEASIQFEVFETLTTNETLNTIDAAAPTGTVNPLPSQTFTEEFEVSWTGTDSVGEIELFAVYVSTNGGPFLQLASSETASSTTFTGEVGSTYGFLCIARDTAGNVEELDGIAETTTTVAEGGAVSFHRGDPNSSGTTDVSDGIAVFNYLFLGVPETLACSESADADNDGAINIVDGIYLLNWLFADGPEPAAPGSPGSPCGTDPDPPGSAGDLGCGSYAPCQ